MFSVDCALPRNSSKIPPQFFQALTPLLNVPTALPHLIYFQSDVQVPLAQASCFQAFVQFKGGGGDTGRCWYGPGAYLAAWTGGTPDSVGPWQARVERSACHGKRAVRRNKSLGTPCAKTELRPWEAEWRSRALRSCAEWPPRRADRGGRCGAGLPW